MVHCPHCGGQLESPASCAACQLPLEMPEDATPFEILGIEPAFTVDARELRRRLLKTSRDIHPDYFGTAAPALRELAERNSARLNEAFAILSDDAARADWLVTSLGGPDESTERAMPQAFLLEVLEWNEALADARAAGAGVDPKLEELETTLRTKRADALQAVRVLLDPLPARGAPALKRARQELNAVRYVDRALGEIEALRLSSSTNS